MSDERMGPQTTLKTVITVIITYLRIHNLPSLGQETIRKPNSQQELIPIRIPCTRRKNEYKDTVSFMNPFLRLLLSLKAKLFLRPFLSKPISQPLLSLKAVIYPYQDMCQFLLSKSISFYKPTLHSFCNKLNTCQILNVTIKIQQYLFFPENEFCPAKKLHKSWLVHTFLLSRI